METIDKKVIERFASKVRVNKETGCHEWIAGLFKSRYGQFRYKDKKWRAHRFSYLLYKGELPKGLCVLHTCDNRKCVNPGHLFLGTHQDNMTDMVSKGRDTRDKSIYTFIHNKKGWKLRCTRAYLTETFNLYGSCVSIVILGKRKSTGGWSLLAA